MTEFADQLPDGLGSLVVERGAALSGGQQQRIAHRLSTIRNADRVVVLDGGRVVQQGRYEELAAVDGQYRQLLASQVDVIGGTAATT